MQTLYANDTPVISAMSTVSTLKFTPNEMTYEIADANARNNITEIFERLAKLEEKTIEFIELSCKNCGGKIQQKFKDPIFKCPYCKTVYAIGYKQVNA